MKKIILSLVLCVSFASAFSQQAGFDYLQVYRRFKLSNYVVTGISNDSTMSHSSPDSLVTQFALKNYLANHQAATGAAIDTVPLHNQIVANASAIATKQPLLTLTTNNTTGAATLTGATLNIPNYATGTTQVTSYQAATATSGQTVFTFTSVPAALSDYVIFLNGVAIIPNVDYTVSSNTITIPAAMPGDKIGLQEVK